MLLSYWYTVRLYKRPQFPEASLTRMLNKFTPEVGNVPVPITASMASSNAPSNTNITVPLPAPGSVVPQKYSACSISTSLYMLLSYWYTVRLYKRPQFPEASLTRMLNKFTPDDGNAPLPITASMASSNAPS